MGEFWNGVLILKKLYSRKLEPLCERYSLTRMEVDILLFLVNNPESNTAKEIIEKRRFTKSHVSAALKKLEQKGYIARGFHSDNKKTVHLTILPASEEIIQDGQKRQIEFRNIIFETFNPDDMERMEENFGRMLTSAQNALQEENNAV